MSEREGRYYQIQMLYFIVAGQLHWNAAPALHSWLYYVEYRCSARAGCGRSCRKRAAGKKALPSERGAASARSRGFIKIFAPPRKPCSRAQLYFTDSIPMEIYVICKFSQLMQMQTPRDVNPQRTRRDRFSPGRPSVCACPRVDFVYLRARGKDV